MSLQRFSEAGQDVFAFDIVGPAGSFLDIGAGRPDEFSNSYGLELAGWRGLSVEILTRFEPDWHRIRKTPLLIGDALTIDWKICCRSHDLWPTIDYLSLDIDEHPEYTSKPRVLTVLENLLNSGLTFKAMTVEHDAYRLGDFARKPVREFLEADYYLYRSNVGYLNGVGPEFEDWFVRRT